MIRSFSIHQSLIPMRTLPSVWFVSLLLILVPVGCDTLNDAVPQISIAGGVFGLGGATGSEMSGSFSAAKFADSEAATASFTLNETFDDLDAGDFGTLNRIITTIGVPSPGGVVLKLTRTGGGSFPATVTTNTWTLNFQITSAGSTPLGTPTGGPIVKSPGNITFSRAPGCTDADTECSYLVGAEQADRLQLLFPFEITATSYLNQLAALVFRPTGGTNSPNTLALTLAVTVTNDQSDFNGLGALLRVGEFETSVRPVVF